EMPAPDAAFTLTRQDLLAAVLGGKDLGEMISGGSVEVDGNSAALTELIGYLDAPDPDFAIVTP
ncbi:MAG: MBL fold metallo-hydrolase, partial [Rhodococcus sp. (in: high G+C Gram-positive bacteria)]